MINALPTVEALFNGIALLFMLAAYREIRRKNIHRHRQLMVAAIASSAIFLVTYLIYHTFGVSKVYQGDWGIIYYPILVTHIILAALVPFLVGFVVWKAVRGALDTHRRVARYALGIWVYVSVTGILVYLFVHI